MGDHGGGGGSRWCRHYKLHVCVFGNTSVSTFMDSWGLISDYWWNRNACWCSSDALSSPLNHIIITCYGNPSPVLNCVFSDAHCEFMMHSRANAAILRNSISWLSFLTSHSSAQHNLKNNSFILSPWQCYLMTVWVYWGAGWSHFAWLPALPSSCSRGFFIAGITCVGLAMSSADWFITLIWV